MNLAPISYEWLRRVRRLTYGIIGIFAVLGLAMTWRAALNGRVVEALAGAVVTLCVLGTGMVWSVSVRLSLNLLRLRRRLIRLERRLGISTSRGGQPIAKVRSGQGLADGRMAGLIARLERFCDVQEESANRMDRRVSTLESVGRHSSGDALSLEETHWADEQDPPGQRTLAAYEHLTGRGGLSDSLAGVTFSHEGQDDKQAMRLEFAALIHRHEYHGALATGDELVNRYPESKAASDFRRVRPHLVRKIQLRETASKGRGG